MWSRFLVLSLAATLVLAAAPAAGQGQGTATAAPTAPEWLDGAVRIALPSLDEAEVSGAFAVHQVTLQGSLRSAQDLRDAYRQAEHFGAGEAFVATVEQALRARLEATLRALFPLAAVEVPAVVVAPASLEASSQGSSRHHPPIHIAFAATVAQPRAELPDGMAVDADLLRAVLELGAVARVPYELTAQPGWNVTYTFEAPSWAQLGEAAGGTLGADGSTASWSLRNWRGTAVQHLPMALEVRAREAPPPVSDSDVRLELLVDLAAVEGLSLPGLLARDFGELLVHFEARVLARSLRLEDFPRLQATLEDRLPEGLALEGLSADGLRRALQRGLLPPQALVAVEERFREVAEERLSGFGATAEDLRGGFDPASLETTTPGAPLAYALRATFRLPLASEGAAPLHAAAALDGPALLERSLTFPLPRLQGLDTTYRVVLPPGIALTGLEVEDGRAEQHREDGRDAFTVTPESDEAEATFTVAVTAGFVLTQFWYAWAVPMVLGAGLVAMRWVRKPPKRPAAQPVAGQEPAAPPAPAAVPAPSAAPSPGAEPSSPGP